MTAIDEVRDRIDIVDLVGEHVQLRKAGRVYKGLCPFHEENTPSFVVYPDSGRWQCFGACATGGDVFSFQMALDRCGFREALEVLARRAGVTLEEPSPQAEQRKAHRDRLRAALALAEGLFQMHLLRGAAGEAGREYLKGRGFDSETARAFGLGWAPDAWTATRDALAAEGYADDDLIAAGLAKPRDTGGVYDVFRGRLVFPIRDVQGRTVGFGARTLDPEGVPKYLNSPQTELFDKGHLLYGLDRAKQAIRSAGRVVIVEGYTDVIRAHRSGFENVVASLGTALTDAHVQTLRRYTSDIVLALDADAAGEAATLRGLDVAREAAAGDVEPIPTARGWIRYEPRADVNLHVAVLPPGRDPDEVVRDDPEGWRALVEGAPTMTAYLFDTLTRDLDLATPDGKTAAVDRLLPVLAAIGDPVQRAAWSAELAQRTGVDERALMARGLPRRGGRTHRDGRAAEAGGVAAARRDVAAWLLGKLLADPRGLRLVNGQLQSCGQPALGAGDWSRSADRDLFEAVRNASRGIAPPDAPAEHRLEALPDALAELAAELRARAAAEPPLQVASEGEALCRAVLRMREAAVRGELEGVRALVAETGSSNGETLSGRLRDLTTKLLDLQRLQHRPVAVRKGKSDAAVR